MIEIDLNGDSESIMDQYYKIRNKFRDPIYVCDERIFRKVRLVYDDFYGYFYAYDNTFMGCPVVKDEEVNGLFMMEKPK